MTDQIETSPPPARHADGRFGPGNPGRRPGSRNRASHRALTAILDDFHDNKDVVLPRLRQYFTTTSRSSSACSTCSRPLRTPSPKVTPPPATTVTTVIYGDLASLLSSRAPSLTRQKDPFTPAKAPRPGRSNPIGFS